MYLILFGDKQHACYRRYGENKQISHNKLELSTMDATRQNHPFQKLKHPRILNYSIQYGKVATPTVAVFSSFSKRMRRKIYTGALQLLKHVAQHVAIAFRFFTHCVRTCAQFRQTTFLFHTLGTNCFTCAGNAKSYEGRFYLQATAFNSDSIILTCK